MRNKGELLSRVLDNAEKASSHAEIELIHGLALLEILVDIRDILAKWIHTPTNNTQGG